MTGAAQTKLIGSFVIDEPQPLDDPRLAAIQAFRVRDESGRRGLAYAAAIAGRDHVRDRLNRRARIAVPSVAAALESGVSESAAFVVEAEPTGERLDVLIARTGRLIPYDALAIAAKIASALSAADLPHGQLSTALVWIDDDGITLSGFAFDEPQQGADAAGLACLVFEMLSGRRFEPNDFEGPPAVRAERIREALLGIAASIANVVSDGTRGALASAAELLTALDTARADAIILLADAANQSLSLKDSTGAQVFLDAARRYDPSHVAIKNVEARLASGVEQALLPTAGRAAPPQAPAFDHDYEPGSDQALFLERLRASVPEPTASRTSKPLPWAAIAAGAVGVFAILTVIVVVIAYSR